MSTPAHDVTRTYDCVVPSCPREARRPFGRCDDHADDIHAPAYPQPSSVQRLETGSLAHLLEETPVEPQPTPILTCKIDGCTTLAGDAKAGIFAGLCRVHREERRLKQSADAKAKWAAKKTGPAVAAAPPPRPEPAAGDANAEGSANASGGASTNDDKAVRLANIISLIDSKRDELIDLQAEALGLLEDLREAVAA